MRNEARDALHHPLTRAFAANVDVTVVGVSNESMSTALQFAVEFVKPDLTIILDIPVEVGLHHHADQLREIDLGLPADVVADAVDRPKFLFFCNLFMALCWALILKLVIVLPASYEVIGCNVPAQILTQSDGRLRVSLMHTDPEALPVTITARRLAK